MLLPTLDAIADNTSFDVVVLGAGGAGMSAALYAAIFGAKVLLVESTGHVGGTTAYSAATTWIVGTHWAAEVNPEDSLENAAQFLDNAVGEWSDRQLRQTFLDNGAKAVEVIEKNSHVQYRARPFHPDYLSELAGSTACGRALEPLPFDGRLLGDWFPLVRPPIAEFMVLGGMMVDRDDIPHLLGFKKSLKSLCYVLRIMARHVGDRLKYPRGTRLLMGNALIGRLLLSLKERHVTLLMETEAVQLQRNASGVVDKVVLRHKSNGVERSIAVKGGVILATGGFNRNVAKRTQRLPGIALDWCPGAPGHTGTAHTLAESVGAHYGTTGMSDCFWAPVSIRKRTDGSVAVFPHFVFDRAKPGMVTVNQQGERFLNESTSYHLFGIAMQKANKEVPCIPAWLITDAEGMRKYGLGMVRPGGMGLTDALQEGYVIKANNLADLAGEIQVPPNNLARTIQTLNHYAETGKDPDFQRGETLYQKANGDANHTGPNPSLGKIATAPFYAVRLYPGDIGAATGFATDSHARVLDMADQPIAGLYAVGNDMHSVMGGVYPGPGITIGPGLVFAYVAARHAVEQVELENTDAVIV